MEPETSAQVGPATDERFRLVYTNTMLTRTWPVVLTGVLLSLQGAIAIVVGLSIVIIGGIALARFEGAEILLAIGIVAVGVATTSLPIFIWRRSLGPILQSRRYLREGQPLASVEGRPNWNRRRSFGPVDTLTVGGRIFDMSMTTSYLAHGVLQDPLTYLRAWYVPTTSILVRAEARERT